jgi:hypothetical protein
VPDIECDTLYHVLAQFDLSRRARQLGKFERTLFLLIYLDGSMHIGRKQNSTYYSRNRRNPQNREASSPTRHEIAMVGDVFHIAMAISKIKKPLEKRNNRKDTR